MRDSILVPCLEAVGRREILRENPDAPDGSGDDGSDGGKGTEAGLTVLRTE